MMSGVLCSPLINWTLRDATDAEHWWLRSSAYCHVDIINICVAVGGVLLAASLIICLRSRKSLTHTRRVTSLPGHSAYSILVVLLFLGLLVELADALLARRHPPHVLVSAVATLVSWCVSVVFHHHVERRRPTLGLLTISCLLWTLGSVARLIRLIYFLHLGLDEDYLRPKATAAVAVLFGALALVDVYAAYSVICSAKHKVENEKIIYRHNSANFFSKATFYWLTSLLKIGFSNPLELENLGELPAEETTDRVYGDFRRIYDGQKKEPGHRGVSLWKCFAKYCWKQFALGGVLKLLGDFMGLVGPMGISVITRYVEMMSRNEDLSENNQSGYATIAEFLDNGYVMSVVILVSALAQGTFSQSSTHLVNVEGIHLKGALQALVYNKAMRLSVWSIADQKEVDKSETDANGTDKKVKEKLEESSTNKQASNTDVGSITNLISEDAFNVMTFFWIGHYIWAIPLKIGIIMYLLYTKLGKSAIIGAAFCIATMTPMQFVIGKKMSSNSKAITELSDERMRKVNEVLQGIKLLKLYGWECVYGSRIAETRDKELLLLDKDSLYWALMTWLTQASSVLITLVTFGVYFTFENNSLTAGNVFAALALFNQLTVPLFIFPITVPIIISALVSTRRLEDFLALPESSTPYLVDADEETSLDKPEAEEELALRETATEVEAGLFGLGNIMENEEEPEEDPDEVATADVVSHVRDAEDVAITVKNGCFSWSGDDKLSLSPINIVVATGKLTLVVGKVGSGKTSLLSALLGEMHLSSGKVQWRSGLSVAYVAQKPWLLNATLRDNITYGQPYRPRWYSRVIEACSLQPDIDILPGKDLTEIGEKGINLSGGQKQRVAIARALYRRATVVIMDDPLSALDDQVGQHVFDNGIKRLLLRQRRTVILVTHRLQLLTHAHQIIAVESGRVRAQGSLANIEASDADLVNTWRSIMTREALEEPGKGRTASERWRLVKLVSRIGVQRKRRNEVDGSWQNDEQADVTNPSFVPFRKRLSTFSGSRYFSHDLPIPTDECDDEFVMRPKRTSTKRSRPWSTISPLGVSALPQHKQVLRSSSLQAQDNLPYPVVRQQSSPSILRDHHNSESRRARNHTMDNGTRISLMRRLLTNQLNRSSMLPAETPAEPVEEQSVLKRLLSTSGKRPSVKREQFKVKTMSTVSMFSDDFNDDEEYDADGDASAGRLVSDEEREYGKIPRRIYLVYLCSCGVMPCSLVTDDADGDASAGRLVSDEEREYGKIPRRIYLVYLCSCGVMPCSLVTDDADGDASAGRLVSDEEREYGKIPRRIYLVYLCSCGVGVGLAYVFSTIVWQGLRLYTDYWPNRWISTLNASAAKESHIAGGGENTEHFTLHGTMESVVIYAVLSVASILLSLSSNGIGQYAGAQARRTLHRKMLLNLLRCPMHFFETTPVGRIINRFSTDMGVIDKKIATSIQRLLQFLLLCFSAILVNAYVTYWFLLVAGPICIIWFIIQRFYRSSARELQRLDSITRSPIFSHFSESLGGLTTIRAFHHQRRFTAMLHSKMDVHTNVFLIINTANRWLGIALDYLGGVIVFVAIIASLLSASFFPGQITSTLVGFAINYTLLVPIYLNWVVKFLSDMEMYMGAVERVEQYSLIKTDDYREQGIAVPPKWPMRGDIVFQSVSLRYDASRAPVVTNFNLHIPAGQKVGICGRSGSGKSSLVMSLFNMIDVCEGNILIDDVDIKLVPLQVLRSRLSIIPQDVLMFSGTIRSNLDPRSQYTDEQLWTSLELAQLKEIVINYPGSLDGEVREGGENLSAGERQLFCLARAILHDAACLIMDEATSSVDPATEKALLAAATRAFAAKTVITIAHRLATILECDRILVLDAGRIVEDGSPAKLLNRSMGIFSSMLRAAEEGSLT